MSESWEGLTNFYIEEILNITQDFKGCFSCDNIPYSLKHNKKFSIICNLSKSYEPGTHWVTIVVDQYYTFYYDSLGFPCYNTDIRSFINHIGKPMKWNGSKIQSDKSTYCGFFAILMVLFMDSGTDVTGLNINFRTDNLDLNDSICSNAINDILHDRIKPV
jgi:hypothetical protein